ncbi:MAG TPA: hypothetical protein VGO47_02340 [Chlamydiales bacterium]|nr:hypothetical protein [Chlamydiales bacterium]
MTSLFPDVAAGKPSTGETLTETEIARYFHFEGTKCTSDMDILPWWKVSLLLNCQRTISLILNHTKENEATFPVIARMALDFLACPG